MKVTWKHNNRCHEGDEVRGSRWEGMERVGADREFVVPVWCRQTDGKEWWCNRRWPNSWLRVEGTVVEVAHGSKNVFRKQTQVTWIYGRIQFWICDFLAKIQFPAEMRCCRIRLCCFHFMWCVGLAISYVCYWWFVECYSLMLMFDFLMMEVFCYC